MSRPPYYPLFLDLAGRLAVVAGAGREAPARIARLLECGARVRLVAPAVLGDPAAGLASVRLERIDRAYCAGDLDGAFLVVAASDDPVANARVWRDASARGLLVNAADDPEHSNWIAPSTVRRGDLAIAVSTGGRCPALAVRIRRELEERFGPEYEEYVELLGGFREIVRRRIPGREARRAFWARVVDSPLLEVLHDAGAAVAASRIEAWLEEAEGGSPA